MLNNPYLQYRRAQAETAEPGELVVMLYRGAINFLQRALLALEQRDYQTANVNIVRAEEVLAELGATLDTGVGDLAANLARIYDYAYWRLVEANCQKDPALVTEVLGILRDLLPSWEQAAGLAGQQHKRAAAHQAYQLSTAGAR